MRAATCVDYYGRVDVAELRAKIRDIKDFPTEGILFKDITTLLKDGPAFRAVVDMLAAEYDKQRVDVVVGIESRGFIIGSALAYALGVGIAIVRKPGKLPFEKFSAEYDLEYGKDVLEIHRDAFGHPTRVLLVDDLLATGGTAGAAINLVERLKGEIVECAFLIELSFLKGRERVAPHPVYSIVRFDD